MLFALFVALSTVQAMAAPPSVPSIESGHIDTYMQDHGKPLFEQFARIRLANVHPGGANAVRDETVATTAKSMFQRAANMDAANKYKYLSGVHQRVTEHENGAQ